MINLESFLGNFLKIILEIVFYLSCLLDYFVAVSFKSLS